MGTWISPSGTPLPYAWVGTLTNVPLRMSSGRDNNHISIMNNGKVGIGNGVQSPSSPALLEIDGRIKINGGNPDAGKVLTTDATGLATWETPSGGFSLPYDVSQSYGGSLFTLSNTGGGSAIAAASFNAYGVFGYTENGLGGVYGKSYGTAVGGRFVSVSGNAVDAINNSATHATGKFVNINAAGLALQTTGGNIEFSGFTKLGNDATAPKIKMKKITGTTTSADNTFFSAPHGVDASKILSISTLVTDGGYQYLPHSPDTGAIYTVNVDGGDIAIGVKTAALSGSVMGKPFKILITYEE